MYKFNVNPGHHFNDWEVNDSLTAFNTFTRRKRKWKWNNRGDRGLTREGERKYSPPFLSLIFFSKLTSLKRNDHPFHHWLHCIVLYFSLTAIHGPEFGKTRIRNGSHQLNSLSSMHFINEKERGRGRSGGGGGGVQWDNGQRTITFFFLSSQIIDFNILWYQKGSFFESQQQKSYLIFSSSKQKIHRRTSITVA